MVEAGRKALGAEVFDRQVSILSRTTSVLSHKRMAVGLADWTLRSVEIPRPGAKLHVWFTPSLGNIVRDLVQLVPECEIVGPEAASALVPSNVLFELAVLVGVTQCEVLVVGRRVEAVGLLKPTRERCAQRRRAVLCCAGAVAYPLVKRTAARETKIVIVVEEIAETSRCDQPRRQSPIGPEVHGLVWRHKTKTVRIGEQWTRGVRIEKSLDGITDGQDRAAFALQLIEPGTKEAYPLGDGRVQPCR